MFKNIQVIPLSPGIKNLNIKSPLFIKNKKISILRKSIMSVESQEEKISDLDNEL